MAVFDSVSTPPGPKVIVPVALNTVPRVVPAGLVTFKVTIMVCGGFAPFLVDPPRLGVVTWSVPPALFTGADAQGTGAPMVGVKVQTNAPPLFTVTVMLFNCMLAVAFEGTFVWKIIFGADVWVVLLMVQTIFPACPTLGTGT